MERYSLIMQNKIRASEYDAVLALKSVWLHKMTGDGLCFSQGCFIYSRLQTEKKMSASIKTEEEGPTARNTSDCICNYRNEISCQKG